VHPVPDSLISQDLVSGLERILFRHERASLCLCCNVLVFFSNVLEAKSGSLLSSSVFAAALAMSVSLDVGGRRHHAGLPHGHHFSP
jgi:hypothetical protein